MRWSSWSGTGWGCRWHPSGMKVCVTSPLSVYIVFIDERRCSNLIKISRVVCCCTHAAHMITALTGKQSCFRFISRSGSDVGVLATVHLSLDHEGSGSNQFTHTQIKKTTPKSPRSSGQNWFFFPVPVQHWWFCFWKGKRKCIFRQTGFFNFRFLTFENMQMNDSVAEWTVNMLLK